MAGENFGLVRQGTGRSVLQRIPIPQLRDDYILVRTVAVALNPTDWTTLDAPGDDGTIVGCDYAGIVEQVGPAVTKIFKKGDRVAGFGHGGNDANPENGAFAKFIAVKGDLQMHIPPGVSFEAAATVGVGIPTTCYALYQELGLPLPGAAPVGEKKDVFIYGGSTATGTIAIQFARLSNLRVITTSSPKHFALMKERGADEVYDYHDQDVGQRVRESTGNRLSSIFDTVSLESTAAICAQAMGADGGVYCNLLGVECPRPDIKSNFFLGYSMSGEEYIFERGTYPASPGDFEFGVKFASVAEELWAQGKWKPHPQRLEKAGLSGIPHGLQQMREGKYSGEKLVYRVEETTWE